MRRVTLRDRLDPSTWATAVPLLALATCLLFAGCASHHQSAYATPTDPSPTNPRGECQRYWDAFELSLQKDERSQASAMRNEDDLADALEDVASSPAMLALIACLSGSPPTATDSAR